MIGPFVYPGNARSTNPIDRILAIFPIEDETGYPDDRYERHTLSLPSLFPVQVRPMVKAEDVNMTTKWILISAAVITLALANGCSTTHEIGKSSAQLFRGEQGTNFEQSADRVGPAIDQALADLKLIRINATTRPSAKQTETVVVARDTQDVRIQIAYKAIDAKNTRVVVSTGAFGSSDLRDKVWDAVRIRLGVLSINQNSATASAGASTTQPTASAN